MSLASRCLSGERQAPASGARRPPADWNVLVSVLALLLLAVDAHGQGWTWKVETVDQSAKFSSAVVDDLGNLHIAYLKELDGIKYGFRPAGSSQWFTMVVDRRQGFVRLAVDRAEIGRASCRERV